MKSNYLSLAMDNKLIVIVGSKPNAFIPRCRTYYCANSASNFYKDEINKDSDIVTIVAASEIVESKRKSEKKQLWLTEKFHRIINSNSSKILLLGSEFFPESREKLMSKFDKEVEEFSFYQIQKILKKLTGKTFPILTKEHLFPINFNSFKNLIKYLIENYKSLFFSKFLSSGLFRPSTGILSLVYAIYIHGPNYKYYVTGIGLNERDKYPDGFNNTWTPRNNLKFYHVLADKKICQILSKKYHIEFDHKSFDEIQK